MTKGFILYLTLIVLFPALCKSQITANYHFKNKNRLTLENISLPNSFSDSLSFQKRMKSIQLEMIEEGFLTFSFDSIKGDSVKDIYLNIGNKYLWAKIDIGNADEEMLSKIGFREKIFHQKPFNQKQLNNFFKKSINYLENNGYPFANIQLDSIQFSDDGIHAQLLVNKYRQFKIDTIEVKGDAKISLNYISNYIGIKKGDYYNESLFLGISDRIKELPFVTEQFPSEVWFSEEDAKVILILGKKKANTFDGVLGLQPDEKTGKVNFTGDVQLKLRNPLGGGETIQLEWKRLQDQTQSILAGAELPFVLNTPLGIDAYLKIFRQDTSFNTVKQHLGIPYYLRKGNYFKAFLENQSSTTIKQQSTTQNINANYKFLGYGLGYKGTFLNYRLNPRKGWALETNALFGEKELDKKLHEQSEFKNIPLKTSQIKATLSTSFYIPLLKTSTIKIASQNGILQNDQLVSNELYRIGGLKTLRGFDEASIFTSSYSINTVEYRLLLEENSFLAAFFDYAYYERKTLTESISDTPFGFGAGITFETKAGIFSLNYALGKQFDNPIEIKNGKVHFGIVNYF